MKKKIHWFSLTELNSILASLSSYQTMNFLREKFGSFQGPHLAEYPGPEELSPQSLVNQNSTYLSTAQDS